MTPTSNTRATLAALALGLLLVACGETTVADTCTGGANVSGAHVVAGIESDATGPFVRITWSVGSGPGAGLPDDYFAEVVIGDFGDPASIATSAELTSPREITVRLDASMVTAGEHAFTLRFPDRRRFIDCTHPGMDDRYLLDVTLTIAEDGTLATAELVERVRPGAI